MRLAVLYDAECAVCVRCRDVVEAREALVPIRFVACRSHEARTRYGAIPFVVHELVVVDDDTGAWWAGSAAFVMTLWALGATRGLAELLASDALARLSHAVFSWISANRSALGWMTGAPSCENGACELPSHAHPPGAMYR